MQLLYRGNWTYLSVLKVLKQVQLPLFSINYLSGEILRLHLFCVVAANQTAL